VSALNVISRFLADHDILDQCCLPPWSKKTPDHALVEEVMIQR
jgi:hypothetical protein